MRPLLLYKTNINQAPCCGRTVRNFQLHLLVSGRVCCTQCRLGDTEEEGAWDGAGQTWAADQSDGSQQMPPPEAPVPAEKPPEQPNPNEALGQVPPPPPPTQSYPWRRKAESEKTSPAGGKRRRIHTGRIDHWLGDHGWATFEHFNEWVLVHAKDMDFHCKEGDLIAGIVARRHDKKLQAFSVKNGAETQEELEARMHTAVMGSGTVV